MNTKHKISIISFWLLNSCSMMSRTEVSKASIYTLNYDCVNVFTGSMRYLTRSGYQITSSDKDSLTISASRNDGASTMGTVLLGKKNSGVRINLVFTKNDSSCIASLNAIKASAYADGWLSTRHSADRISNRKFYNAFWSGLESNIQ